MAPLYGFINLEDVMNDRVTEVGVDVISKAVDSTLAEHERQMNAFTALFAETTTKFKSRFLSENAVRLQPLDNKGRALPLKPGGKYDLAWPVQMGGGAWGQDFVTSKKMTVAEAQRATKMLVNADIRWMRDHILAAIFNNANWAFEDDEHGTLTVMPLANGDAQKYTILKGADESDTDDHFKAQANAIGAGADNPFPDTYDELVEHPENAGNVISMIPTNLKSDVEGLAGFREARDSNIKEGANTDVLVGSLGTNVPGEVIGYVDKNWIVEWRSLPDNYIISVTSGGDKPLKNRVDEESDLVGFRKTAERNDHPFYESQWMRRAGFGANNRVGALVRRIGNAAYGIPAGYETPMS